MSSSGKLYKMSRLKRKSIAVAVAAAILAYLTITSVLPRSDGDVPMILAWRVGLSAPLFKLDELLAKGHAGSRIEVDVAIRNGSLNSVCIRSIVLRRGRVRFVTANGYIEFDASDRFVSSIQSKGTARFASNPGTAKFCFNSGVVRLLAVHPDWTTATIPSDETVKVMVAVEDAHGSAHRLPVRMSGGWQVHRIVIEFDEDFDGELSDSIVGGGK